MLAAPLSLPLCHSGGSGRWVRLCPPDDRHPHGWPPICWPSLREGGVRGRWGSSLGTAAWPQPHRPRSTASPGTARVPICLQTVKPLHKHSLTPGTRWDLPSMAVSSLFRSQLPFTQSSASLPGLGLSGPGLCPSRFQASLGVQSDLGPLIYPQHRAWPSRSTG